MSRVLVALSGGVDSSVAAAVLRDQGHDVTGVTMKLWGGESDTGCCSVADVDDARRVAYQLGIDHHVFNFGDQFETAVVAPYVADHAAGRTPNPCVECNRHIKFDKLLRRAAALGFDSVATGHHARVVVAADGLRRVARGADQAKDQSYVVAMLGQDQLARIRFPVGTMTKAEVRATASKMGLRTAAKPDSQDVCFIAAAGGGRSGFLHRRLTLHPGRVVDSGGRELGTVPAVELVTVGQRRGLGLPGGEGRRLYVTEVSPAAGRVVMGGADELLTERVALSRSSWVAGSVTGPVSAQTSAHGYARPAVVVGSELVWAVPQPRVAFGQTVVFYDGDEVVGSAIAG